MRSKHNRSTNTARYADKKWYPRGVSGDADYAYKEYLLYNLPAWDPRIAERYGESERENNERINRNDPEKHKSRQQLAEEFGGSIISNLKAERNKVKKVTAKNIVHVIKMPSPFIKWEEYPCQIVRIDDFGNATIAFKDSKDQGIIYNARKIWLSWWMKRDVLSARVNKKGKYVFELPKNPEKIVPDYYDAAANGVPQEDILKKLFSQYGSKSVKETLKSVIDEETLEKVREEYKNSA